MVRSQQKITLQPTASHNRGDNNLATYEGFLKEWANLLNSAEQEPAEVVDARIRDLINAKKTDEAIAEAKKDDAAADMTEYRKTIMSRLVARFTGYFTPVMISGDSLSDEQFGFIEAIRLHLTAIWQARREHDQLWYLHNLRALYSQRAAMFEKFPRTIYWQRDPRLRGYLVEPPPEATEFDRACLYLQSNLKRLRMCASQTCHTPYFMTEKKGQKYCTEECAIEARRGVKMAYYTKKADKINRAKRKQRKDAKRQSKRSKH